MPAEESLASIIQPLRTSAVRNYCSDASRYESLTQGDQEAPRAASLHLQAALADPEFAPSLLEALRRRKFQDADAEDALQDVYFSLLSPPPGWNIPDEQAGRRAYCLTAAYSQCLRHLRKRRWLPLDAAVEPVCEGGHVAEADDLDQIAAFRTLIDGVLGRMEPEAREILEAAWFGEMAREDIAFALGISRSTVQRRLRDALEILARLAEKFTC